MYLSETFHVVRAFFLKVPGGECGDTTRWIWDEVFYQHCSSSWHSRNADRGSRETPSGVRLCSYTEVGAAVVRISGVAFGSRRTPCVITSPLTKCCADALRKGYAEGPSRAGILAILRSIVLIVTSIFRCWVFEAFADTTTILPCRGTFPGKIRSNRRFGICRACSTTPPRPASARCLGFHVPWHGRPSSKGLSAASMWSFAGIPSSNGSPAGPIGSRKARSISSCVIS